MKRRAFLQSLAAYTAAFALPIRTTKGSDGSLVHRYEIRQVSTPSGATFWDGMLYGFVVDVPAQGHCVARISAEKQLIRILYMTTAVGYARVSMAGNYWPKPIDAAIFSSEICPVDFPLVTEKSPLAFSARSMTGKPEQLCVAIAYESMGLKDPEMCGQTGPGPAAIRGGPSSG